MPGRGINHTSVRSAWEPSRGRLRRHGAGAPPCLRRPPASAPARPGAPPGRSRGGPPLGIRFSPPSGRSPWPPTPGARPIAGHTPAARAGCAHWRGAVLAAAAAAAGGRLAWVAGVPLRALAPLLGTSAASACTALRKARRHLRAPSGTRPPSPWHRHVPPVPSSGTRPRRSAPPRALRSGSAPTTPLLDRASHVDALIVWSTMLLYRRPPGGRRLARPPAHRRLSPAW